MADIKKVKDKAVGLFWRKPAAQESIEPVTYGPLPITPAQVTPPPISGDAPPMDAEFYRSIEQELNRATPAEFAEFYNQLATINEKFAHLDEYTRYQLAFNAAQTALKARNQPLTVAQLLSAVSGLNAALDSEKRAFTAENEQGYQSNVTTVRNKVSEIAGAVTSCEARLEALQKEIEAFLAAKNQEKAKLEQERMRLISERVVVESELTKLESKKGERAARFSAALEAHRKRIENLKQALQNHLKGI